jgi:rhamnogalacturonan endolyase
MPDMRFVSKLGLTGYAGAGDRGGIVLEGLEGMDAAVGAAYSGARPWITLNGWRSRPPSMSKQPNSRSITIGTYRGDNATFTFEIPAKRLVVGTNTLSIDTISGKSGSRFLSPGYAIDCIDFH